MEREYHLRLQILSFHYSGVMMSAMASQIISLKIGYSIVYSGADQRKYQSSASLAFVREIHRWSVNSPHKGPVTRKCFHLMKSSCRVHYHLHLKKHHKNRMVHGALMFSCLNKPLDKQSCRCFKTPWHSCDITMVLFVWRSGYWWCSPYVPLPWQCGNRVSLECRWSALFP